MNAFRNLLGIAFILASQGGVMLIGHNLNPAPAAIPKRALSEIPLQLGAWSGASQALNPRVLEASGAISMLDRDYTSPTGDRVLLHLGIWTNYYLAIPHYPTLCYHNAGWELMDTKDLTVPRPGADPIPARLFVFQRQGDRIAVLFWCHFGNLTAVDHKPLRKLRQSLRRVDAQLPPLVKVMLQTGAQDLGAAERRLLSFAPLALEASSSLK